MADTPVMSYDPLPPVDSVSSYSRPKHTNTAAAGQIGDGGLLSTFFRSLLPGYNLNEANNPQQQQQQPQQPVDQPNVHAG